MARGDLVWSRLLLVMAVMAVAVVATELYVDAVLS